MSSEETQAVCKALTKAGQPCRVLAMPGSDYCTIHQPVEGAAPSEPSSEEQRRQLTEEVDALVERVRARAPGYEAPPYSPRRLVALLERMLRGLPERLQLDALEGIQTFVRENVMDPDFWKGTWYMLNYAAKYQGDLLKRRYTGEYETDDWGVDWDFVDAMRPFLSFLYKVYWRVTASGLENVPVEGRAVLVSNHASQLPWDATMIETAVLTQHPAGRLVRGLYGSSAPTVPFLASALVKLGQTLETVEDGLRLLEQDQVVAVFPEGLEGIGKPFKDRYRLARFGRGDFVRMALRAGAPMIPVSVVGSEETSVGLAKLPGWKPDSPVPYLPITLTFPWFGILGLVPLPTKWYIDFGPPLSTGTFGPDAAENPALVSQLVDQARNAVQDMLAARLAQRQSVFKG